MTTHNKSVFENINDFLKVTLWPLIVIILLFTYRKDMSEIFQKLSKISYGSFTIELEKEAKLKGAIELSGTISGLSATDIKKLLSMGSYGIQGLVSQRKDLNNQTDGYSLSPDIHNWNELLNKNLVVISNPYIENSNKIDDVVNLFKSLKADEIKVYYDDKGSSSTFFDSRYPHKGTEYFIPDTMLNKDQRRKLEAYSITLTETGVKVIDIIIETTARQIIAEN